MYEGFFEQNVGQKWPISRGCKFTLIHLTMVPRGQDLLPILLVTISHEVHGHGHCLLIHGKSFGLLRLVIVAQNHRHLGTS